MKLNRMLAAPAAIVCASLLVASPAAAQATRTWVSGVGDDANPCSRTAPCKTFAGALAKTGAGGEINCLDPGAFGSVTITKPLTIDCETAGGVGGVLATAGDAIDVSIGPGQDTHVQLIGLDLDGGGAALGGSGVKLITGANVLIKNCLIYGFVNANVAGVRIQSSGAKVTIENTTIRQNAAGVMLTTSGIQAVIENSLLDGNATANLVLTTAGSNAFLNHSTLINTPTAISNAGGGVLSTVTNFIRGAGAPNQTVALE